MEIFGVVMHWMETAGRPASIGELSEIGQAKQTNL
jgi:hypothetical protein